VVSCLALKFNAVKCKLLQIGNSQPHAYFMIDSSAYQPIVVNAVSEEKDLGIWCTDSLKPSFQCQRAAAKAMQVLGFIRRSFIIFSSDMLTFLYKMYVRPHLEYCASIWCPYFAKDIDIISDVPPSFYIPSAL